MRSTTFERNSRTPAKPLDAGKRKDYDESRESTDPGKNAGSGTNREENAMNYSDVLNNARQCIGCLLYTSPSPRDAHESRMPSSA